MTAVLLALAVLARMCAPYTGTDLRMAAWQFALRTSFAKDYLQRSGWGIANLILPAEEWLEQSTRSTSSTNNTPAGGKYLMYPVATIPQVWVVRFGSTLRVLVWSTGPAMAGGPHAGLTWMVIWPLQGHMCKPDLLGSTCWSPLMYFFTFAYIHFFSVLPYIKHNSASVRKCNAWYTHLIVLCSLLGKKRIYQG